MDRDQFRARLTALGLTCQQFADISGYSSKSVYHFGATTPIPHIVRYYLATLEQLHRHHIPLPAEITQAHAQPSVSAQKILRATLDTF